MASSKDCPMCKGSGRCHVCKGKGKTGSWITKACTVCERRSGICPRCKGSGRP
jgi:hypothetical protein